MRVADSTRLRVPCQPLSVAFDRRVRGIGLGCALIAVGSMVGCTGGEATDSASPTGTASIGGSTGGDGSGDSTTTSPTTAGVTSSVPTTQTTTNPTDPTLDPSDTSDGCLGCINAAGICESGEFDAACGRGGSPCMACESPAQCAEGVCEAPPSCSPDNCDGCCDGDTCVAMPSNAACGADGSECTACDSDATCIDGACELPCEDTCLGCCTQDGECIDDADQSDEACGYLGFECEACTGDQTCDFGVCSSPSCIETCDGCCVGDTCYDGFEEAQCGYEETCEVCVSGQTCDGVDCVLSQTAQWEVVLLSGEITPMQPGGGTWDSFGGAPDPYLDIEELMFESAFVDNTVDPVWNETITSSIVTTDLQQTLTFRMRDSDVLLDQVIGVCSVDLPDSAFGGPHEVECNVGGNFAWSVLLSIQGVQK